MGSTFGHMFRVTTWGESHGGAVGVIVDGCPPRLPLCVEEVQADLDRRRPGQSRIVTQRQEEDHAHILSGVFEGRTLGTPISILVWNKDVKSMDYVPMKNLFRPSHADYTTQAKYGIRNWMGGGRASARETVGRVAAGAIARKLLHVKAKTEIIAYVKRVHAIEAAIDPSKVRAVDVERNIVRCPNGATAEKMIAFIEKVRKSGDSVGGVIELVARRMPVGLGEPVFDKLEADLAKALLSLPASKGFEIGSGFAGTTMLGSEHNDPFVMKRGRVRTRSNRSGGVQGGISNGEDLILRVAFKPTATIVKTQETVDVKGKKTTLRATGRHDPCVLPRAVPIVESMVALVLADHYLRQQVQCG